MSGEAWVFVETVNNFAALKAHWNSWDELSETKPQQQKFQCPRRISRYVTKGAP